MEIYPKRRSCVSLMVSVLVLIASADSDYRACVTADDDEPQLQLLQTHAKERLWLDTFSGEFPLTASIAIIENSIELNFYLETSFLSKPGVPAVKRLLFLDTGSSPISLCPIKHSDIDAAPLPYWSYADYGGASVEQSGWFGHIMQASMSLGNLRLRNVNYSQMQYQQHLPCCATGDGVIGLAGPTNAAMYHMPNNNLANLTSFQESMDFAVWAKADHAYIHSLPHTSSAPVMRLFPSAFWPAISNGSFAIEWSGSVGQNVGKFYVGDATKNNEYYFQGQPLTSPLSVDPWYSIQVTKFVIGTVDVPISGKAQKAVIDSGETRSNVPVEILQALRASPNSSLQIHLPSSAGEDPVVLNLGTGSELLQNCTVSSGLSSQIMLKPSTPGNPYIFGKALFKAYYTRFDLAQGNVEFVRHRVDSAVSPCGHKVL